MRGNIASGQRIVNEYEQTYARNVMLNSTPPPSKIKGGHSQMPPFVFAERYFETPIVLQVVLLVTRYAIHLLGRQIVTVVPLSGSLAMFSEPLFNCMNLTV